MNRNIDYLTSLVGLATVSIALSNEHWVIAGTAVGLMVLKAIAGWVNN